MDAILESLRKESKHMVDRGYELNQEAKLSLNNKEDEKYFSLIKESIKQESFGRGIVYTLKKLGLI